MLVSLIKKEMNYEIVAVLVFIAISGLYLFAVHGPAYIIDNMFLSIFSASIVILLTLLVVKIIEHAHYKTKSKYSYVDWRKH
jgi:hypothetical protein